MTTEPYDHTADWRVFDPGHPDADDVGSRPITASEYDALREAAQDRADRADPDLAALVNARDEQADRGREIGD